MYVSLYGLGLAAALFAAAFFARFVISLQFDAADAQAAQNPDRAAREAAAKVRQLIRMFLNADLVILPLIGYFIGASFLDNPQ